MNRYRLSILLLLLSVVGVASCDVASDPAAVEGVVVHGERGDKRDRDEKRDEPEFPDDDALEELASFKKGKTPGSPLENAVIGPDGGTVSLGDFEIVVPAGAVDRNTLFQIRRPRNREDRHRVVAELQPHNVTFAVPIKVRFPLEATSIAGDPEASVVWWDDDEEEWVALPTTLIDGGTRIETETTHLSFWGIKIDSGGFAEISSGGE